MMTLAELLVAGAVVAAVEPSSLAVDGGISKIEWLLRVSSPNDDWINDLVPLANGNILGVGFLNRQDSTPPSDWAAIAVEFEATGKAVSEHLYGEGAGVDAFWSAIEGEGGRRMFAGFTTRIGRGGIDGLSLLANSDGSIAREKTHGWQGYDRFTDVTQAADGFVFVGHSQQPGSDLRQVYLVGTDGAGEEKWHSVLGGAESWGGLYVEPSGDGGFIVSGGVSMGDTDGDMFVIKTDGGGRELWRKRVGTPDWDEINHGLVVRSDGTIVLVGYTNQHGKEVHDLVAATLTREGEFVRLERWGGSGDDRAILPKLDERGQIWVVGQTASAGAGGYDLLLTSIDTTGAFTGQATVIGGKRDDHGTAILPLRDGSLAVAGYSDNLGGGGEDAFIAKLTRPAASPSNAFKRTVVIPAG